MSLVWRGPRFAGCPTCGGGVATGPGDEAECLECFALIYPMVWAGAHFVLEDIPAGVFGHARPRAGWLPGISVTAMDRDWAYCSPDSVFEEARVEAAP